MAGPVQPDYVLYDQKEREVFLSQIGVVSPPERELFHKLCKVWAPEISYQTAISIASAESATAKGDIAGLMTKLAANRSGLLCTQVVDGSRTPVSILLCNQDDFYFYVKLLDELLVEVIGSIMQPLASQANLTARSITIPPNVTQNGDFEQIAKTYANKEVVDPVIYRLPCPDPNILYISSTHIKRYITVVLAKLQVYFQNSNILAAVAQLRNTSLMDLKRQVESKDTVFWEDIARFVLEQQAELTAQRKLNLDPQFFQLAYFIRQFLGAQAQEIQQRRKEEAERQADMRQLVEQVRTVGSMAMSDQQFAEAIVAFKGKYQQNFQAFKDDFDKLYLVAPDNRNLPVLVHSGSAYIHMDNVQPYFASLVDRLSRDLLAIYVKIMEQYLKHPNDPGFEFLYSATNLEDDIGDKVKSVSPTLWDFFQRPNLVAEGLIHAARKQKSVKGQDELKQVLSAYFYTDKIRFKPLSVIFGLQINDIFRLAFIRLSLIRQIILRVTGKYESFVRKFSGFQIEGASEGLRPVGKGEAPSRTDAAQRRQERLDRQQPTKVKSTSKATSSKANSGTKPQIQPVDKKYSSHERDSAWEEFSKTLKK